MNEFLLPQNAPRDEVIARLIRHLHSLAVARKWRVTVKEDKSRRTNQQNRYLWGVCYPTILEGGGETLRGWTSDDLHEYFLGEWSGWEVLEGFGRKRMRPYRRSSNLSITEFMYYMDTVIRRAAKLGIVIPDPRPEYEDQAA